jgi:hypothetical protein
MVALSRSPSISFRRQWRSFHNPAQRLRRHDALRGEAMSGKLCNHSLCLDLALPNPARSFRDPPSTNHVGS